MGVVSVALLPAGLVLAACSADPVDLGDGRLGIDRSALESYAAVWEGYVEAHEFASGSDKVRLVLDEQGNGTITFGEGEPLPVPSDFQDPLVFERYSRYGIGVPITPIEGAAYTIDGALVEAERLRAVAPSKDIMAPTCALQTPHLLTDPANSEPLYGCVPREASAEGHTECAVDDEPVSCAWFYMCNMLCACDAAGCVPRGSTPDFVLDAALDADGTRLEGTVVGIGGAARATMRLTRVAAP